MAVDRRSMPAKSLKLELVTSAKVFAISVGLRLSAQLRDVHVQYEQVIPWTVKCDVHVLRPDVAETACSRAVVSDDEYKKDRPGTVVGFRYCKELPIVVKRKMSTVTWHDPDAVTALPNPRKLKSPEYSYQLSTERDGSVQVYKYTIQNELVPSQTRRKTTNWFQYLFCDWTGERYVVSLDKCNNLTTTTCTTLAAEYIYNLVAGAGPTAIMHVAMLDRVGNPGNNAEFAGLCISDRRTPATVYISLLCSRLTGMGVAKLLLGSVERHWLKTAAPTTFELESVPTAAAFFTYCSAGYDQKFPTGEFSFCEYMLDTPKEIVETQPANELYKLWFDTFANPSDRRANKNGLVRMTKTV